MTTVKRVIKIKAKEKDALVESKIKRVIKIKKGLPIPPIDPCPISQTAEAFEILREYYEEKEEPIPQSDLKWYYEAIEQDKKNMEELFTANPTIKAMLDSVEEGKSDEQREIAEKEAKKKEPVKPESDDLGPMPEYGSGEFWAWCRKRKAIRLAKEAAIIAAGGTVPPEKVKKPKTKAVKDQGGAPKVRKPKVAKDQA
jgi:hypothetical protein